MAFDPIDRSHAGVRLLRPYQPGKPVEEVERELGVSSAIKLASNENPLGCGSKARVAIAQNSGALERYPDGNGFVLKRRLAEFHNVDSACITLGNGSNDVLDLVARVFLGPGKNSVFSQYAFAVYPLATLAVNAQPKIAAARTDTEMPMGHDPKKLLSEIDEHTGVVFIANPNNPTGTWMQPAEIDSLLDAIPDHIVVVLDEAYREYQDKSLRPDSAGLLKKHENLVVTRTFSKVHGLAALRVGYSISSPAIADLLNRVRQPFNVNSLALAAAAEALGDEAHVAESVSSNQAGLNQLQQEFHVLGIPVLPTQANFITFKIGPLANKVYEALLQRAVIIRPLDGYQMSQWLRVTVGTAQENGEFILALRDCLEAVGWSPEQIASGQNSENE